MNIPLPLTNAPADEAPLSADARQAMRAYLQRAEVRLSTLHRIAVAFISGAGLLILLPVFFREDITVIMRIFITEALDDITIAASVPTILLRLLMFVSIALPFTLSLALPLYALWLLMKDVTHFYFTIYTPGFPAKLTTPSFALSGVCFSPDESPEAKRLILAYQYQHSSAINFAIPFSAARRAAYFEDTVRKTNGEIIPKTRRYEVIEAAGVLSDTIDRATVEHFGTAFGLARTLDRDLVKEVALSEISLVRHIIYLRRMMLRYMKTLLLFIWTTLITFIMLPFLQEPRIPVFITLSVFYFFWSLLVMPIMRTPMGWMYRHVGGVIDDSHVDTQLVILEGKVKGWVRFASLTALVGVVVSLYLYLS